MIFTNYSNNAHVFYYSTTVGLQRKSFYPNARSFTDTKDKKEPSSSYEVCIDTSWQGMTLIISCF